MFDPDNPNVESLGYKRRRPTKLKKSRRGTSKQKACQHLSFSGGAAEGGDEADDSDSAVAEPVLTNKTLNKDINKNAQIFGNKSTKNVLSLSVDTPETAEIEAKQGKIGSKHVFPVWETRSSDTCKCVNGEVHQVSSSEDNAQKSSIKSGHMCQKCSQVMLNNKRGCANNNNSNAATEANGAVDGPAAAVGNGPGCSDVVSKDGLALPLQDSSKQIAVIVNLLALVGEILMSAFLLALHGVLSCGASGDLQLV